MPRESLVTKVVDQMLDEIISGGIDTASPLPPESDLATRFEVSRLTLREALKVLQSRGVVRVVPGTRNAVNPVGEWTDIAAVLRAASHRENAARASVQLVELRRIIETGAAALAAERRTEADVDRLRELVGDMRAAHEASDVSAFVVADIAFHDVIFAACGNVFLPPLLAPLSLLLRERRVETSSFPEVQAHAILKHEAVLDAIASGEPESARAAMDDHMIQTAEDLAHYALGDRAI